MSPAHVNDKVAALQALDLNDLREQWARRYGTPPALRSVPIMRMLLAWQMQVEASGGLSADTRRMLARKGSLKAEGLELGIGARLTRNWQGRTHEVIVETAGFRWEDKVYPSLSAVASAIAGSKWNGPRFFGLRAP